MSDSITPFGTTRSVFSLATNDLEINGDITASKFLGSGEKLTNIRINSINQSTYNNNEYLLRSLGGTGNRSFIDKGILFNNDTYSRFESSSNFRWNDTDVYSISSFPTPSVPLTSIPGTKLLIFQGDTLPLEITDNSGMGNVITNGTGIYNIDNPFGSPYEGSIQFGTI